MEDAETNNCRAYPFPWRKVATDSSLDLYHVVAHLWFKLSDITIADFFNVTIGKCHFNY